MKRLLYSSGLHSAPYGNRVIAWLEGDAEKLCDHLDPKEMRYVGVKSAAHFRSGFESWSGAIHCVAEPSVHNPSDGKLAFKNLERKLYPFDEF